MKLLISEADIEHSHKGNGFPPEAVAWNPVAVYAYQHLLRGGASDGVEYSPYSANQLLQGGIPLAHSAKRDGLLLPAS